jgi:hypothetical protein
LCELFASAWQVKAAQADDERSQPLDEIMVGN